MNKSLTLVALLPFIVAGCTTTNENVGALSGAVLGGVVGSQFGKGTGAVLATGAGALAGTLIGGSIGRRLDEADRLRANQAQVNALQYSPAGSAVSWQSPNSGNYGQVVPGPVYSVNSQDCREYTHTIYIDGRPEVARGVACRQPDGSWRPNS